MQQEGEEEEEEEEGGGCHAPASVVAYWETGGGKARWHGHTVSYK